MSRRQARSILFTGVLIGIGTIGFLDETIFHQLLQWHAFYWATDEHGRILSDGLFHLFSTLLLLWGLFRVWRGHARWIATSGAIMVAGMLMGAGGFNFYDGIIQHAIFHFHLVNEHVCNVAITHGDNSLANCPQDIPYEVVWDSIGLILLLAGFFFWRQHRGYDKTSETRRAS
ncbi:MAG: DUF2243 domain-containing protein [Ktedonobacteraceae bacterium]|nr:DUF2243 domain-containing protein [Ktedonobacteraceae bacterium]